MTLPSRLAALTLCATFLVGQPTVVCDLACTIQAHRAPDVPAGTMAMESHHGHGAVMQCQAHQVRTQRVPPAALVVSTSLPVTTGISLSALATRLVAQRPAALPVASARRAVEPPPPRLR